MTDYFSMHTVAHFGTMYMDKLTLTDSLNMDEYLPIRPYGCKQEGKNYPVQYINYDSEDIRFS